MIDLCGHISPKRNYGHYNPIPSSYRGCDLIAHDSGIDVFLCVPLCVCMHACVRACACVCMYVCVFVPVCVYEY